MSSRLRTSTMIVATLCSMLALYVMTLTTNIEAQSAPEISSATSPLRGAVTAEKL